MKYEFNTFNLKSGNLSLGQLGGGGAPANPDFVFDVTTDNSGSSNDDQFTLPLSATGTYDFNVDWGDGNNDDISAWDAAAKTHTFTGGAGTYTVTITGTITGFRFDNTADKQKIIDISNWGDLNLGNEDDVFRGCSELIVSATDSPTVGTTLKRCFWFCSKLTQVGSAWDLTGCLDIGNMFQDCLLFNDPNIGDWDVSGVTGANGMASVFDNCVVFNQDISGWDVSNADRLDSIFKDCIAFNQDISGWVLTSCTSLNGIFFGASIFNQDISGWDTSAVTDMRNAFRNALAFNQDLGASAADWDTSNVTLISGMFEGATAFNGDISAWDVSLIGSYQGMFLNATAFNTSIDDWTIKTTGGVLLNGMFEGATAFNQTLNSWDTSEVTNASSMFLGATAFNQDISGWDTGKFINFTEIFSGATAFDQNLGAWDVTNINSAFEMFLGVTLSTANYNGILTGWEGQVEPVGIGFHGGNSTHSGAGTTARNVLTSSKSWTITDGGAA